MSSLSDKVISALGEGSVSGRLSSKGRMHVEGMKIALLKGVESIIKEEFNSTEARNAVKQIEKLLKQL